MNAKLLFIISFLMLPMVKAAECGRITSLRGVIEVLRSSDESNVDSSRRAIIAAKKMKLFCSDILVSRRSSRAKIRLINHTSISMGPNSRVEILNHFNKEKGYNYLKLTYGKMRAIFKPQNAKVPSKLPEKKSSTKRNLSKLKIKTPSVVAGVRGTDFYIAYSPLKKESEQATLSGSVEVADSVTGESVIVNPGKQVIVKKLEKSVEAKVTSQLAKGKNIAQIKNDLGLSSMNPEPIKEDLKTDIRQTSALVRSDKMFANKSAVKILGSPKTWKLPVDEIPLDLKDIKEEF